MANWVLPHLLHVYGVIVSFITVLLQDRPQAEVHQQRKRQPDAHLIQQVHDRFLGDAR